MWSRESDDRPVPAQPLRAERVEKIKGNRPDKVERIQAIPSAPRVSEQIVSGNTLPNVIREADDRPVCAQPGWAELVEKIKRNDPDGLEELYGLVSRGVRFYLRRQLGPLDLDDQVHDTFIAVAQAIQRGKLCEPDRLTGYVRAIARRQATTHVVDNVLSRRQQFDLDWGLAVQVLKSIGPRDREILIRFYLREQPVKQICSEMGLTDAEFHLLKSRATAFGKREISKRKQSEMREDSTPRTTGCPATAKTPRRP